MNTSGCDNSDKKKAQNRQAQKLYRQRMKEKVRNLQAKVDAFEQHVSSYEQTADESSRNPSDSSKFLQTTFESPVTLAPYDGSRPNPMHRPEPQWAATMEEILYEEISYLHRAGSRADQKQAPGTGRLRFGNTQ